MEGKNVNNQPAARKTMTNNVSVLLHRPPSGKPKVTSSATNIRNRRLRMPLPPEAVSKDADSAKVDADLAFCLSPPSSPQPTQEPIERRRPLSANPVLSRVTTVPVELETAEIKEPIKVNFSPEVQILNPPIPKITPKVKNVELDLGGHDPPSLKKPPVKKIIAFGQSTCISTRKNSDPSILETFLENTSKPRLKARPSSATTYTQNFCASKTAEFNLSLDTRPVSASLQRRSSVPGSNSSKPSEKKEEGSVLEPFVFGFKSNKVMCGSETDLVNPSVDEDFSPFKMREPPEDLPAKEQDGSAQLSQCQRNVPETLQSLIPWLTEGIPLHWTGVESTNCLMFLPSLNHNMDDLPVVPPPHGPMDDLPYKEIILPQEKWNPKKYTHRSFAKTPEWQCQHKKTEVRLYNKEGILLYERYLGTRTKNVVRKEITELEKLMKGVGTDGSDCMVVQFQADITRLRKMIVDTLKLADNELFKRPVTPEPTDHFGLRKFYQEHDEIMEEIKKQHKLCVQELALIETTLDLDDGLRHFNKVVTLTEAGMG